MSFTRSALPHHGWPAPVCSSCFPAVLPESVYAPLPKTQRAMPVVLGGDPKGASFVYANGSNIIVRNLQVGLRSF